MLSLAALANWEAAVLMSVQGATGTADERDCQITQSGMYAEYPAIFGAYLELLRFGDDAATVLEVLKRVVFLAWYSFKQPSIVSAISELPESGVREVMGELEAANLAGRTDDEFRWMLARYYAVFGYVFDHFGPVRSLESFIERVSPEDTQTGASASPRFSGWGQLGAYWKNEVQGTGG